MTQAKKRKRALLLLAFLVFVIYIGYQFVMLQIKNNEQNTLLAQTQAEISEQQLEIDELTYILENGGEAGYLEKIARGMGYVDPQERVFVDISK